MDKKEAERIALKKYNLLVPLITKPDCFTSNKSFFDTLVSNIIKEGGNPPSVKTMERWYYSYKHFGFDGLKPKERSDAGQSRKGDELIKQIIVLKRQYPRMGANAILSIIRMNNTDAKISISTITRIINKIEKDNKNPNAPMFRYEVEHINEVWHGDSSAGPYLYKDKKKIRLHIIAFIDDKSRLITTAKIFESDNTINLFIAMKNAVSKYGVPKKFNFDNGSNYKNYQTQLLIAKIGSTLHYCRPRNPEAKAKIERWFKTMKDQWMSSINYGEFHSIEQYQDSLNKFVHEYNNRPHSSLNKKSPYDVYLNEIDIIKKIDEKNIEESFLFEVNRKVTQDNVVLIEKTEFEVPSKFCNRKVQIKYLSLDDVYIYDGNEKIKIRPLDKKANSKRVRVFLSGDNYE